VALGDAVADVAKVLSPKISVDKNLLFPFVAPTGFAKLPIIVTNTGTVTLNISTIVFQVDAQFSLFQDKCDVAGINEEKLGILPSTVAILPDDKKGADLDLHFARLPGSQTDADCDGESDPWFSNPFDCMWFNPSPPWGSSDPNAVDDPVYGTDDTHGAARESIYLAQTEAVATYSIGIHDYNNYGFGASSATVSIYMSGVLVAKFTDYALNSFDMWYVANLNWPNQRVGGSLPPLSVCKQSGDACLAKKDPSDPKGGKMWQTEGDRCITPCYYRKDFDKKPMLGSEALCKSKK